MSLPRNWLTLLAGALVLAGVVIFFLVRSPQARLIEELQAGSRGDRVEAVHALERIGSRRAAEAIAGAVGDADSDLACHAVSALGRMARPEDIDHVRAAMADERADVRAAAVYAMSGFGERADLDFLMKVLADHQEPEKVRAAAAKALGRLRVFEAAPALINALADRSQLVRARACAAFRQLAGADFGFRAGDPPQRRREAISKIRDFYPVLVRRHERTLDGQVKRRSQ